MGDILLLIYWEWMNMESKNGNRVEKNHLAGYSAGDSEARVEYNIIEDNRIEYNLSTKVDTTQALIIPHWNENINELIESIKQTVQSLWLVYKKSRYERERAQNILTWKDFSETCRIANMTPIKFSENIIKLSTKLDFWKWKIYNCETLYKHYASVYNEWIKKKEEINRDKTLIIH